MVGLADGQSLGYDRLVRGPGIIIRFDALPGYDEESFRQNAACLEGGEQTMLLRKHAA